MRKVPIEIRLWLRVQCAISGCWEWQGPTNNKGYGTIGNGGRSGGVSLVHRLVYSWVHGPIGKCVLHKCDNRRCVRPSHLFAGTPADNSIDMVRKGRSCRGLRHPTAKLTPGDVREIRELVASGCTQRSAGELFGVHNVTVSDIARGRSWGWLK